MRKKLFAVVALASVLFGASAHAAITTPAGSIPNGLPARLLVGLFEESETWMKDSAVPWDVRYAYFTKGWANNWGWGPRDGAWASAFFRECDEGRFIPAVQYYQMNLEAGGGESAFYAKTQNASTMATYFADFKLMLQRAKEFGKPIIVLLEADGFGYLQQQSNNNPNAYAAIAASGMPELAGLPNTVAGWGLAFLQLRKSVGANNVVLGVHISDWASGKDIGYYSVTDPLQPEVDKVYNFLAPLGLSSNVTGATYDLLVGDPLDRDPDYYRLSQGRDMWWNTADNASISSKSFNRYAEWLRLWNVKAGKRWMLWQIPLGNSNHLNVDNNGAPRQGYKGNFPEYFFSGSTARAHQEKFASSGVIGLLFGAGATGMSSFENDIFSDGQGFMKSRAGAFLSAGGLAIPTGGSTTPPPPPPPPPTSGDTAVYNFESSTQGWSGSGAPIASVSRSTAQKYAGSSALAVQFNGSGNPMARVANPGASAGKTVTYRVFVPATGIAWIQPYVLQGAASGWAWTGNWQPVSALSKGAWNTLAVQVPANASALAELGVQFGTSGAFTGAAYIDSVSY